MRPMMRAAWVLVKELGRLILAIGALLAMIPAALSIFMDVAPPKPGLLWIAVGMALYLMAES